MPRLPRYRIIGQPYHVIQRGNNRAATFFEPEDYRFYRRCLKKACAKHGAAVHAYAFMTNHVHVLLTPNRATSIEQVMQSVAGRYAQRMNLKQERTGPFWDGRYRSALIDSEQYLLSCYRYIELNPVRAGIVSHPGRYAWSSYHRHAFGYSDDLVSYHDLYRSMGETAADRQSSYRALFGSELDEETLHMIRFATHKGWALGSKEYKSRIERESLRRSSPLRGRSQRMTLRDHENPATEARSSKDSDPVERAITLTA